ncbi:MAG: fluoroquinolone export ABC transporter permease subunit [Planctomycetota bacterium]|jgi:fluoroquinolone transport system permease protein
MSRLIATLRTDACLQLRNGFYYAVAFVLLLFTILITQLPAFDWSPILAPVIFGNLVMVSFFFIGGLILLEKAEGTLEAQVVTPLRVGEYLGSKVASLAALSLIESLVMVSLAAGTNYEPVMFCLGVICTSVLYSLFGFVTVARYDSINEFIMPATAYIMLLSLPYLDYFEVWESPLMILHPMQGSMIMMAAAFVPVASGELIAGLVSSAVWIGISCWLARRAFRRFLIRKEGTR